MCSSPFFQITLIPTFSALMQHAVTRVSAPTRGQWVVPTPAIKSVSGTITVLSPDEGELDVGGTGSDSPEVEWNDV